MDKAKTVLISGSSRGIGRAIAEKLMQEGYNLSLGVRDEDIFNGSILDPKMDGDNKVIINHYDANILGSEIEWVNSAYLHFNSIDCVINCAGIFRDVKFMYKNEDESGIEDLININLMAPWRLTRAAWPFLKLSKQGRVVVLVSMSGVRSKGTLAGYSVSKFGLMGLCQTIRNEGWDDGIRVSAICPGWVNTDMSKGVINFSSNEMTQPKDLAKLIADVISMPNSCVPFEIKVNCSLEK